MPDTTVNLNKNDARGREYDGKSKKKNNARAMEYDGKAR